MDRRSWLWRRKSSEKSPGETDSSGSLSSHSERYSDDQVCPAHSSQSHEVTSKATPEDEGVNDGVRTLSERLSAALLDISAKEELVKQHVKVAEEAVSGWEKAEKEVLALKQQLEASTQRNKALEDRVNHLDGALKECVRQLRQAREDQEQKVQEAIRKKISEWESTKSELQNQLSELQEQLQTSKTSVSADHDLRTKLEAVERENSALKLELLSRAEELEMRILERELSTQAAESASKQLLESIKKISKLESECRRQKAMARRSSPGNDLKSLAAYSVNVESCTDNQSDSGEKLLPVESDLHKMNGQEINECPASRTDSMSSSVTTERDPLKNGKAVGRNLMAPSVEINLMDDFLEMERLVASPDTESGSFSLESISGSNQTFDTGNSLKAKLEVLNHRNGELEAKLQKMDAERMELVTALIDCQKHLETSQTQMEEAAVKLVELQTQLAIANETRQAAEKEIKIVNSKKEVAESQLRMAESEIQSLHLKVGDLEIEIEKKHTLLDKNAKKNRKLEDELMISQSQLKEAEEKVLGLQTQLLQAEESNQAAMDEVNTISAKREMAELQVREADVEIKNLLSKVVSLEKEVENAHNMSAENIDSYKRLEDELEKSQSQLKEGEMKLIELQNELNLAYKSKEASKKEFDLAKSHLRDAEAETEALRSKVSSLEEEIGKERALSAKNVIRTRELEDELLKIKREPELRNESELQGVSKSNKDLKIRQEKELEEAANKLAECQKTIASLGQQLESLATMEDIFDDVNEPRDLNYQESQYPLDDKEPWILSAGTGLSKQAHDCSTLSNNGSSKDSLSLSVKVSMSSEMIQNGLGKIFPRTNSGSK